MNWAAFFTSLVTPDLASPPAKLDYVLVNVSIEDGTGGTPFELPNMNSKHAVYQLSCIGVDTILYILPPALPLEIGDIVEIVVPNDRSIQLMTNALDGNTSHTIGPHVNGEPGSVLTLQKLTVYKIGPTSEHYWISRHSPKAVLP